ncbi:MAG: 6-phosphogluconolactonase [Spirochaetales bacterium]|nr:6-phosphogluconolactonase [Spirochaetales bacterium]
MIDIKTFSTVKDISVYTLNILKETAASGQTKKTSAALSFGNTYNAIFKDWAYLLKDDITSAVKLPELFPADERIVDLKDPASNWGIARKLFIDYCGTESDKRRWASDSATYLKMLETYFETTNTDDWIFDVIFLGLGPDGHTASLFPGNIPEESSAEWNNPVLKTKSPFEPPNRLTLGPELIARSRRLFLTVTGASKVEIFKRFLNEINDEEDKGTPQSLLPPSKIINYRKTLGLKTEILCDKEGANAF